MQLRGRVLQGGRLLKAALAFVMVSTIATADVVDVEAPADDTFGVLAVVTLDSDGAAVEFGTGWEEHVDFSVRIDGDGVVFVNGMEIGDVGGTSQVRIEMVALNGSMTIAVFRPSCGTLLCTESGFTAPSSSARVRASGADVECLEVG